MDNTREAQENLIERLRRWYVATRDAIGEARLLASLDDETIKLLAQDNALTAEDLRSLIRKGPHAADEMAALMRLLNIDPEAAKLAEPATLREMHMICAQCGEKSRCRRELADHSAITGFEAYCGNAERLDAMRARPELQAK